MVTQRPLEALFMVRIHVGLPIFDCDFNQHSRHESAFLTLRLQRIYSMATGAEVFVMAGFSEAQIIFIGNGVASFVWESPKQGKSNQGQSFSLW
jgi:hypothetical protein